MKKEMLQQTNIDSPFVGSLLEELKEGPKKWSELSKKIGAKLKIEPDYLRAGDESFREMRNKLNTRPGVMIANHPCTLDMCFVFPPLQRSDILVMTQRKRFPFFENIFGAGFVMPAPVNKEELEVFKKRVFGHISAGGLFIIFPSGGEEMSTGELHFKSGFRVILEDLAPTDMVYAFYIDPAAGKKVMAEMIGPPRDESDTAILLAPQLHVRPRQDQLKVKVNECYSEAREWQAIIKQDISESKKQNELLTRHFLEKVGI